MMLDRIEHDGTSYLIMNTLGSVIWEDYELMN